MIINREKYSMEINNKGAIVSLISGGKQFVKTVLPLLQFRLRSGGETQILTSDEADNIAIKENGNNIVLTFKYTELNISFNAVFTLNEKIEATLSYENKQKIIDIHQPLTNIKC